MQQLTASSSRVLASLPQWLLAVLLVFVSAQTLHAADTDIFAGGLQSGATAPRILIVLDNTSNWSRQSQQWPRRKVCPDLSEYTPDSQYAESQCPEIREQQGQAEVAALKAALAETKVLAANNGFVPKVGLMEFTTAGNANQDGGFVRVHLSEYNASQETLFDQTLEEIYGGINAPVEKRNSNTPYGNLMYDIYNYLSGSTQSFTGLGTPADRDSMGNTYADARGYSAPYSVFASPLDDGDACADTFVIFISNPSQSGPAKDSTANSNALRALYAQGSPAALAGDSSRAGLQMPEFIEAKGADGGLQSVGFTTACFPSANACDAAINGLAGETVTVTDGCPAGGSCDCVNQGKSRTNALGDSCPGRSRSFEVFAPTGSSAENYFQSGSYVDGADFNMDDWSRYLHRYGVNVTGAGDDEDIINTKVTTFTVDVFNAQPSTDHSALMASAANQGGGYRLQAGSYTELKNALTQILSDILAVNTSFAAVSLPLSATNRTQSENKVFVGMFRPAQERKPRWHGNLKQFQLGIFDGRPRLADANLNQAINNVTGFADACAESFWTESTSTETISADGGASTEIGGYFTYLDAFDPPPEGECLGTGEDAWSDLPDGPFVEKGGVAQQIRRYQHNAGSSTRSIFTVSGASPLNRIDISPTPGGVPAALSSDARAYLVGESPGLVGGDTTEDASGTQTAPTATPQVMPESGLAATVHGDVVHSTPLSISYGRNGAGDSVLRVFYGANDGLYRAVDPGTGREDWAFISPEHLGSIQRLYENTPAVQYSGTDLTTLGVVDEPKPYFLDGSSGVYTVYDTNNRLATGYVYPTMRRGGRMLYALNVCDNCGGVPPQLPTPMWQAGCDTAGVCSDGRGNNAGEMADLGQTWSTPTVTRVNGYANPVLLMGGGWNTCLDNDVANLASICPIDSNLTDNAGGATGSAIFMLDAVTGALIKKWDTEAPVVAGVVTSDILGEDAVADVAYAVDVGGAVYRLAFLTANGDVLAGATDVDGNGDGIPDDWTLTKIAAPTATSSRALRFMNTPALAPVPDGSRQYVFIALGAGDREKPLRSNYPSSNAVGYKFYALIDRLFDWDVPNDNSSTALALTDVDRLIDMDDLAPNDDSANDTNTYGLFSVTETNVLDTGRSIANYDGWVFNLGTTGEQVVNPAAISGGTVFFNSYIPDQQGAACTALGAARSYRIPLFAPTFDEGEDIEGGGIPIPPIIATVELDEDASCVGPECDGERSDSSVVTVCIGCSGFQPLEVKPLDDGSLREVYRAENIDIQ